MNDPIDRENYNTMIDFANDLTFVPAEPNAVKQPVVKTNPAVSEANRQRKGTVISGSLVKRVIKLLETGPATAVELAEALGITTKRLGPVIFGARKHCKIKTNGYGGKYELIK